MSKTLLASFLSHSFLEGPGLFLQLQQLLVAPVKQELDG